MKKILLTCFVALFFVASAWAIPVVNSTTQTLTSTVDPYSYSAGGFEAFTTTDFDGVSDNISSFLFFEYAGYKDTNDFGLYTYNTDGSGNVSVAATLDIFKGNMSAGTGISIAFDFVANTITNQFTSCKVMKDVEGD